MYGHSRLHFTSALAALVLFTAVGCGDTTSEGGGGSGDTGGTPSTGGAGAGNDGGNGGTGTGGAPPACEGTGDEITDLVACDGSTATPVDVPLGCAPNVDGTLHADEWSDGECFLAGDMTTVVKFGEDTLFIAASGQPTCGCPMGFYFDPDPATDGDEFALGLFDDPFNPDGDRGDFVFENGEWVAGEAPAGIVTACPPDQPSPVRYEISIPYSALGLTAGTAHDVGYAFVHAGVSWPEGLSLGASGAPDDTSTFGVLSATW